MPELWHLLQSGTGPAAENMGWDEALLEAAAVFGRPVLRFYGWMEAAATFGYSQSYGEVAGWTPLRPLIRRPTGGGLVPHDADWTYSLVFPPGHWWYELKAMDSYERVHEWIRNAFAKLNVATQLSPSCEKKASGQCFVGAEQFDLLWGGRKVAGAAQRRNRLGLLIQGSVQPPASLVRRGDWERFLRETVPVSSDVQWEELKPNQALMCRAKQLAWEKYSRAAYNEKR